MQSTSTSLCKNKYNDFELLPYMMSDKWPRDPVTFYSKFYTPYFPHPENKKSILASTK